MELARSSAPAVTTMAADMREVVTRGLTEAETGEGVARVLRSYINRDDLLDPEHRQGDPNGYRQHILHVEKDGSFSIVSLVWLPKQQTAIHDHVSWCVVGVHQGIGTEERFNIVANNGDSQLALAGTGVAPRGDVMWLSPPGDIHRVSCSSPEKTISIHVYGADISLLGTSVRREYDLPIKG